MYSLAQINIARIVAPLSDPRMAGFVAKLAEINALADATPGFLWRLQTAEGDATAVRAYEMTASWSICPSGVPSRPSCPLSMLRPASTATSCNNAVAGLSGWRAQGHCPTVEEVKERLEYLRVYGATAFAFSLKPPFPAPDAEDGGLPDHLEEESA